ncbi:MAG: thioredoxin [Lachnospiraceae bacterium]|nr:thioredoxin [Lachnospiraceae bacterium]
MIKSKTVIRIVLVLAALGMMIIGLHEGGFSDVLNKAVRICYECIGIG